VTGLPHSSSGGDALAVAEAAARKAGDILKLHFRDTRQVEYKGRANIVTDVDLRVEDEIRAFLQAQFPDHSIVSEESSPIIGSSEYTWVLDPLDGTNNYSFGIPFFGTIIALKTGDDVTLGMVYDPLRDELFSAVKGRGTTLNRRPASVSGKKSVKDSLIGTDLGYVDANGSRILDLMAHLWPDLYAFRIMGSAGLGMAYASCGRLDLYFHLLVYPWELACGQLLVTEAGGVATDFHGGPPGTGESSIIVSNKAVHTEFLSAAGDIFR
jgi:myo-inositol-1(or 4)-monophosphatase